MQPTMVNINPITFPLRCACDPLQDRCDGKTLDFCLTNSTCFSAAVRKGHKTTLTMGCLDGVENSYMTCRVGSKESVAVLCCNSHHYCNRHLSPQISQNDRPPHDLQQSPELGSHFHETIYALIGFTLLTLVGVFLFWFVHSRGKLKGFNTWVVKRSPPSACHSPTPPQPAGELKIIEIGDSTLKGLLENSCTSGSGSGAPLLAQRTISWSIELVEMIGRGRYGQVWRGIYQDEAVAVKIFSSHAEAAWRRECNIYKTVLLRHENILTFIAADTLSRLHSCTQLWLITRYHEHGSLYDYLNNHTLDRHETLEMLTSAVSGLVHLHTTIIGSQGKPGIAHRDIKSKNILVMANKRCCIADLGLAVIETRFETFRLNSSMWNHCNNNNNNNNNLNNNSLLASQSNEPINLRVGTKRYMSPEVIDGSLDVGNFDAFKKSDVYSFALVMWETCKRCLVEDKCDDYELPYLNAVPGDPSYEDMNFVVCRSKARPPPAQRWSNDRVLTGLFGLMEECWSPSPGVRHSMLRLKKSIVKLSLLDKSISSCNNNNNDNKMQEE